MASNSASGLGLGNEYTIFMRTLTQLKSDLQIQIRDKSDGTVEASDMTTLFNRAIRKLRAFHRYPGTKQEYEFDVFDDEYEYATPSGYRSIIDFRVDGKTIDFEKRTAKEFWHDKDSHDNIHADDNYNETKIILINRGSGNGNVQIHACDTLAGNGTWAADAATDALNVTADSVEYKTGSGSINFDIDVSQTGTDTAAIANSTFTAVDLSDHENKSTIFCRVYVPDATYTSSFTLRWGSDASNYFERTVTTQYSGIEFKDGWNILGFAWNGATETGTADTENIDYLYFLVTYDSSQTDDTDYRLDDVRSKLPERIQMKYYSNNFVKDADGTYETEFDDDDDQTTLDDSEDDLLFYLALQDAYQILREDADATNAKNDFIELFNQLSQDAPSEEEKPSDYYAYVG